MIDPPPVSDFRDTGIPRWVKLFGIIAVVVAMLVVIMMFMVGGDHGPGRHMRSGSLDDHAPGTKQRVQKP